MKLKLSQDLESYDLGGSMTDISFLLIIFFLVTTVFVSSSGLPIALPPQDSEATEKQANQIVQISVSDLTQYNINGTIFTSWEDFATAIQSTIQSGAFTNAIIKTDDSISYKTVIDILNITKTLGISEFTLEVDNKDFLIPMEITNVSTNSALEIQN